MPSPKSTATARPDLGGAFMQLELDQLGRGFIGTRVFPYFTTPKQAGSFKRVTIKSLMESVDTRRAPGGTYARGTWQFEDDYYATQEHGEEEVLDDRESENYADYFEFEVIGTARARHMVMDAMENRIAAKFSGSTNTNPATANWSDHANAKPVSDVEAAVRAARRRGVLVNQIVMPWTNFRDCRLCDEVVDKLVSQGAGRTAEPGKISAGDVASVFDVEEVVVAGGLKDANGQDPNAELNIEDIWTPGSVYVHRAAKSRDLREPCSGRTFLWTGDGAQEDGLVETYREENRRGDIVRCRHDSHEKELFPEAIQKITGV